MKSLLTKDPAIKDMMEGKTSLFYIRTAVPTKLARYNVFEINAALAMTDFGSEKEAEEWILSGKPEQLANEGFLPEKTTSKISITTVQGSFDSVASAIEGDNNYTGHKTDGLGFETVLRAILKDATLIRDIILIDDALAAFTKRGFEIPDSSQENRS